MRIYGISGYGNTNVYKQKEQDNAPRVNFGLKLSRTLENMSEVMPKEAVKAFEGFLKAKGITAEVWEVLSREERLKLKLEGVPTEPPAPRAPRPFFDPSVREKNIERRGGLF